MKKHYKKTWIKTLMVFIAIISCQVTFSQIEFKMLEGFGTRFNDVNDSGICITGSTYFNFHTEENTPMEGTSTGLVAINNLGDVSGTMFFDEDNFIMQPAYKKDDNWYPIGWFPSSNPSESSFTTYGISENSKYVTGQMSNGCCDFGTFLYDTETEELFELFDPEGEALAGYTVNSNGIIGGWLDQPNSGGTLRVPAYFNQDGDITLIPTGQLPEASTINSINDINDNNIMVGEFDGQPFIYDLDNDEFTSFEVPDAPFGASFTSVSNNGVAIGYAGVDFQVREAIIYHPYLGDQPIFLKDILIDNGIDVNTFDGMLGTAYAISPDGNYVVGWVNGPPIFAEGWAIYLDDLLLQEPECDIFCPDDIIVTADFGETGATVGYGVAYECDDNAPETTLTLINGLESGAFFPIGETTVTYQLIDTDENIFAACSFDVIVEDYYCNSDYEFTVEPITYVEFAGIENETSNNYPGSTANEYFLDIEANVEQGESYPITLEGHTGGDYTNFFTVFIDWNQDGEFNTSDEMFPIGSIANSDGTDGQQATGEIEIPNDALPGSTRMRVVKNYDVSPGNPCNTYDYGQTEDYTIVVEESDLGNAYFESINFALYPNPVLNTLHYNGDKGIQQIVIYSTSGQKIIEETPQNISGELNVSNLSTGVYFVEVISNNKTGMFKIVKE